MNALLLRYSNESVIWMGKVGSKSLKKNSLVQKRARRVQAEAERKVLGGTSSLERNYSFSFF